MEQPYFCWGWRIYYLVRLSFPFWIYCTRKDSVKVSLSLDIPHCSGDISKSFLLLWPLSIQWPDLSCRNLDNPLLVVSLIRSNLCFTLFLCIAGTNSLYLWELESAHLQAHLSIAIYVFAFFESEIVKSIFGGRWVAFFAAIFVYHFYFIYART